MEKGMIFQYVIIGVVFVCIVVYVVWKVKNGGKTGGCSCCDIKDCKLKQTKKKIVVNVVKTTDFFLLKFSSFKL